MILGSRGKLVLCIVLPAFFARVAETHDTFFASVAEKQRRRRAPELFSGLAFSENFAMAMFNAAVVASQLRKRGLVRPNCGWEACCD